MSVNKIKFVESFRLKIDTYKRKTLTHFFSKSWCPHCKHLKPRYIEFSDKIHKLSLEQEITIETFAISCVPQAKICRDKEIHGYPSIFFYPPYSTNGTKLKPFNLNPKDIFKMVEMPTVKKMTDKETGARIHQNSKNIDKDIKIQSKPYFIDRSRSETFHDAHLSFDFAMKTAIFTQTGPLPEKPRKALRKFLLAMKKTLPSNSSMQPVVHELLRNFDSVVKGSSELDKIMARNPPPEPKWSPASLQHGTGELTFFRAVSFLNLLSGIFANISLFTVNDKKVTQQVYGYYFIS